MNMNLQQAIETAKAAAMQAVEAERQRAEAMARHEAAAQARAAADAQQAALARTAFMQALVDITFLVGAADGTLSDGERATVVAGLQRVADLSEGELGELLADSQKRLAGSTPDAVARLAAEVVTDAELRRAVVMVAAASAYQSGGVGTAEGLALQAISRAFGIELKELHQLMAEAARS